MEFLYEYGLFLAQAVTIVVAILLVVIVSVSLGHRQKAGPEGYIEIRDLNDKYEQIGESIRHMVDDPEDLKAEHKAKNKADKAKAKQHKKNRKKDKDAQSDDDQRKRLYVLNFDGDIKASATDQLREEISAVLPQVRDGDEILLKLESPGGMVHSYGLASSQLKRITDAKVQLVVAVDKVAASGGYMMACVANRIISAPFAVIGSIGVIAQLPNFHRLLQRNDVDFEMLTAGEYKRTLTMFGENTDKGREKFVEELEETHELFKDHVGSHRPQLDIAKVATGEVWYGQKALEVGLVDELATSDGYVQSHIEDWDVYEVKFVLKKSWQEKLGMAAEGAIERSMMKIWQRAVTRKTY